jgi:hypothetical protein
LAQGLFNVLPNLAILEQISHHHVPLSAVESGFLDGKARFISAVSAYGYAKSAVLARAQLAWMDLLRAE